MIRSTIRRIAGRIARRPSIRHWEGVYASSAEVPSAGLGFDDPAYIDKTRELTKHAIDRQSSGKAPSSPEAQLLASYAVAVVADKGPLRILDFGGAMGVGYAHLRAAIGRHVDLDYVVVDSAVNCEQGRRLFSDPSIRFMSELPTTGEIDVIYACSSLQYVANEDQLLKAFAALRPAAMFLADVPAVEDKGFWSTQLTIERSRIPYHFLSLSSLARTLEGLGYSLEVRGIQRQLRTSSLHSSLDVSATYNLLFVR